MKKITLILGLIFTLTGCALVNAQKANWEACKADVACSEQAKAWQQKADTAGQVVTTGVATVVPGVAPAIIPVGKVTGFIGFALAMLIGGHALNKKKVNPSV